MGVLIRMALRNLMEHRAKTLIIGIIIAVGVMVIVVGNAFLDRAQVGVKTAFTENFTGDVYVYGKSDAKFQMPPSILFGAMVSGNQDAKTPLLPDYPALYAEVSSRPGVRAAAGLVTAMAMFTVEDKTEIGAGGMKTDATADGERADAQLAGGAVLMGIEPETYRSLFDAIEILEGDYLKPGQKGLMISKKRVSMVSKAVGLELKLGDEIILQGISAGGFNTRKAPIVAIFQSKTETDASDFMAYADLDTVRLLSGLTVGGAEEVAVPESAKALAAVTDEEDIFGMEEEVSGGADAGALTAAIAEAAAAPKPVVQSDSGAWQFILLRLDTPALAARTAAALNAQFAKEGIKAAAGTWEAAASPFSGLVTQIRAILGLVMFVLAVVAVVIIMNTLVVSVIERTGEIGTMRALGAQKGFVWKMFFIETLCITVVFGLAGIVLAGMAMGVVNMAGIQATNSLLKILFGGPVLTLVLEPMAVLGILILVFVISVLAHIYPVMVALRIQPVRAMRAD